jgi:hypothetical protein
MAGDIRQAGDVGRFGLAGRRRRRQGPAAAGNQPRRFASCRHDGLLNQENSAKVYSQ